VSSSRLAACIRDRVARWAATWAETDHPPPEARRRAEALVRDLLSAQQYAQLRDCGYLDVPSRSCPARVYRVRPSRQPVEVYEDRRLVDRLCVQPVETVPLARIVVLHKLRIEGAETAYLDLANQLP
jgi:hypothetical protein